MSESGKLCASSWTSTVRDAHGTELAHGPAIAQSTSGACGTESKAAGRTSFASGAELDIHGRMATLNSYLKMAFKYMWFVGFYMARRGKLTIGAYQGEVLACGVIEIGAGVCGTAAASKAPVQVDDVHAIENYIACDDDTQSELVLPVLAGDGQLIAVLDIDSDVKAAFMPVDTEQLVQLLQEVVTSVTPTWDPAA